MKPTEPPRYRADLSDQQLAAEYAATRAQHLFNRIVERHGPMVLQTSFRQVGNWHDAEDVTQAVFLLLAQRAHTVKNTLGGWLHKATRDVAVQVLRTRASRARREEVAVKQRTMPDTRTERELREELDVALIRLPERVREAVVLRYLEGRGQEEAANIAGCDKGTLSRRCTQGLNQLETMLSRRGMVVAPAVLVSFFASQASACVPAATMATLQGIGASGAISSAKAVALAKGAAQAMFWAKVKICAAMIGVATMATAGVVTPLVLSSSPPPQATNAAARETFLKLDFEDGKLPAVCTRGKVVEGPPRAGNRFCLMGDPVPDKGHLVFLSRDGGLVIYSDDLFLVFDIWVDATVATVDMNLWDRTQQASLGIGPLRFPRERWVEGVVIPLADFKHGSGGMKPGDSIVNLGIHAGQVGGTIWIDNLELVRSTELVSRPKQQWK